MVDVVVVVWLYNDKGEPAAQDERMKTSNTSGTYSTMNIDIT